MALISQEDVAAGMRIVSNDLRARGGFTLLAFCYNELFFLPAFLDHYRRLGVERFIVIDDRSTDGTENYLARQLDVMTLQSDHRYGAPAAPPHAGPFGSDYRVGSLWRTYLFETFCVDQWAMLVDIDEFAYLPPGLTFPQLAARLDPADGDTVYGPMIDTYPEDVANLERLAKEQHFNPDAPLFFDAVPILAFGSEGRNRPQQVYGGARNRLMMQYGIAQDDLSRRARLSQWLKWRLSGHVPTAGNLGKGFLVYWRRGDVFYSAHRLSKSARRDLMIPIFHHKLNGSLFSTIDWALESGAYNHGSRGYRRFEGMLAKAAARRGTFLGPHSASVDGYESAQRSGNAPGLEAFAVARS